MTLERLQALLAAGTISQDEYNELAKNIAPSEPTEPTETEPTEPTEPTPTEPTPKPDDATARILQSRLDREMAKERKEKADLKRQLERLQKKVLTDEEQRQLEFEEQQRELEEQRKELTLEKNKMYAVKAMQKAEIDGSEEAMLLMEKLVASCTDETDIDDTINLLKAWRDKDVTAGVNAEVEKRFKSAARTPEKSNALNGGKNPWAKDQWNFTQQMAIMAENPELAARLEAEAKAQQ